MANKKLVVVPYWIANRLKSKNLPLSTCLDYLKMRDIFPLDELLLFYKFNNNVKLGNFTKYVELSNCYDLWDNQYNTFDTATLQEFNALCQSSWTTDKVTQAMHKQIADRLSITRVDKDLIEPNVYEIVDFDINKYALIIKPGFLESTENIDNIFDIVKALLKISYMYSPVHMVSNTSVFRAYVKLLQLRVTGLL